MPIYTNIKTNERIKSTTDKAGVNTKEVLNPIVPSPAKPERPVITPEALNPAPTPAFTTPATPVVAPTLQAQLEAQTDDFTKGLETKTKAAETSKTTALTDYLAGLKKAQSQTMLENDAYAQEGGVNDLSFELNDINDQIRREQLGIRRARENVMDAGGQSKGQAQSQLNNLERESLRKQADLSIIQMAVQGRYDSAKEIADRASKAQFEQQNIYNEALRVNYEDMKSTWTTAEQREFETLLGNRDRSLRLKEDEYKSIQNFAITALQAGAPPSVAKQIQGAQSMEEAIALGGSYLMPKPAATSTKAPDLQNFGTSDTPVWKQYNPATSAWEDVSGLGGAMGAGGDDSQKTLDQLSFLRNSTARILGDEEKGYEPLYKQSGFGIGDRIGGFFKGDTKYRRLETQSDTLKTNVLALMTDPSIRKFFGPQMSNADVQLIQSAGTTLRPSSQSPAELKAETERLDDLLNRMETAVRNGQSATQSTGNIITAPDGMQIELID